MKQIEPAFYRYSRRVFRISNQIGIGLIFLIVLLVTADVVGRYFLKRPVRGTLEISEYVLACVVFLSLAHTQFLRGHVTVDLLVSRLSPASQAFLNRTNLLIGAIVFSLMTWQGISMAMDTYKARLVSDLLKIPAYPFRFVVPLGAFFLAGELFLQFFESLRQRPVRK